MPAYGKVKVDTITYDLSGTATDVSVSNIATKASPTFTGTVTVPTPSANDNTTKAASTAYVQTELGDYALKAGPTFTGTVNAADLVLSGDLTVNGSTTTIDTTTLQVGDKNIQIGKVSTPSDVTADGGGLTLLGATNKTWNWVNSTDAWTSSEHIHLGDDKKLLIGTGSDLEIFHDGNNSHIRDTGTGSLFVKASTFYVNSPSAEDMITATADGAVTLYHNNSAKLATTATGINVTGAINVNGSALSVSPSVTANADGAIGAGDAVEIQANGTVKKIAATVVEQGAPTLDVSKTVVDSGGTVHNTMAISPEGINLSFYRDSDNSNYPTVRAAKINTAGNGFDFGTEITVNSASSTVHDAIYLTTNNGNPIFACCWSSSSHTYLVAVMVNATTLACTYTSNNFYGVLVGAKMATFGSGTVFCVAGSIHNQAYLYRLYSYNDSAATVGALSNTQAGIGGTSPTGSGNGYVKHNSLLYDPDAQRLFHFCQYAGGNDKGYTIELDIVGQTTIASGDIGTPSAWNNNMSGSNMLKEEHVNSCYDTENNRAIIVFTDPHEGKCMAMAGPISTAGDGSKTYAWGTALEVDSNQCSNVQVIFDPNIKKAVVNRNDEGGSDNLRWNILTLNTSDNSLTLGTEFSPGYTQGSNSGKNSTGYDVTRDVIVRGFRDKTNDNAALFTVKTSTTTTTAERLLGFNQAAVTNGNAATIDIVGATNENQSSLTVGSKYYVQKNGTIATTADVPSVEAGIAVAATKLVVKG